MTTAEAKTKISRVVRPGSVPDYDGRRMDVFVEIEYEGGKLSLTGVEGPRRSGNAAGSCGQIAMGYAHRDPADNDSRYSAPTPPDAFEFAPGWDAEKWLDLLDVWKRWHLNDMQAGCEHQRALGWQEVAAREVTIYHWRVSADVRKFLREAEALATTQLREGRSFQHEPETLRLLSLPRAMTTWVDEAPAPEYEPNGPQYDGDHYNRPSEKKTLNWLRPNEHPDGILTKPCPECGYRWGTEWRRADVPADVLAFLESLPPSDKPYPWGRYS